MRVLLAAVLVGHAVAHLVGCLVPWQLITTPEVPYRTTAVGGLVHIGPTGVRVLGVAWLVMALAFMAVASGLLLRSPWSRQAALTAVAVSTMLCVIGWPDARYGLLANALILPLLFVLPRSAVMP